MALSFELFHLPKWELIHLPGVDIKAPWLTWMPDCKNSASFCARCVGCVIFGIGHNSSDPSHMTASIESGTGTHPVLVLLAAYSLASRNEFIHARL